MQTLSRLIIHHTGGRLNAPLASTQSMTAQDIDEAHRVRFGMRSTLKRWGGYNFYINKWGEVTQFRAIGEETMGATGYNFDSIHICLAGNFMPDVDYPTVLQKNSLKILMEVLIGGGGNYVKMPNTLIKVPLQNIIPHRAVATTQCFGMALDDGWARRLAIESYQSKLKHLMELLLSLKEQILKLGKKPLAGESIPCWLEYGQE